MIIISVIVLLLLFYNFGQIVLKRRKESRDSRLCFQDKKVKAVMRECFYGRSYHCRSQRLLDGVLFRATLSLLFFAFHNCLQSHQSVFPILNVSLSSASILSGLQRDLCKNDWAGVCRYLKRNERRRQSKSGEICRSCALRR